MIHPQLVCFYKNVYHLPCAYAYA